MSNLAKNVLGIQQAAVQPELGTLTVRAPASTLKPLNQTLADLLDGKSEVLLDVKIYEVENTQTRLVWDPAAANHDRFQRIHRTEQRDLAKLEPGAADHFQRPGQRRGLAAIAAILIASGEVTSSILTQPFATFGNGLTLTGLTSNGINGNLSLNAADTRSLDQVQIRLDDNAEGTIRSGTRYPITTSSYSSIASSSVSIPGITSAGLSSVLSGLGISASSLLQHSAPIPQVQYQDLGLTLKVTPGSSATMMWCSSWTSRSRRCRAPVSTACRCLPIAAIRPTFICATEPARWWWATLPGRNRMP
jgi:general secretion pathway protein D